MSARDATVILAAGAGTQFDPTVVEAFLDAFRGARIPTAPQDRVLDRTA